MRFALAFILSLATACIAIAQDTPLVAAEVRKVDVTTNKVTLRHEFIPNLEMPAMTMDFTVSKAEMLVGLKPGDRIRFAAERAKGQYLITRIDTGK